MNQLTQLQKMTTIVADTGDLDSIRKFQPEDATTNPSLVLKAIQSSKFDYVLDELKKVTNDTEDLMDRISVEIGDEILKIIPGYISTEVNARLSFDTEKTIEKARKLIALYEQKGWSKDRVLIKVAATWEGIRAAKQLEKEGIHCNLTLLFSMAQAQACADASVTLISPFVGRILDWYKQNTGENYLPENDPGVTSVKEIYAYYKKHGYNTIVMGASFRNTGEILELAGCDRLTIAPALLEELSKSDEPITLKLQASDQPLPQPVALTESEFRFAMNQNAMATEKLAEGIRNFISDQDKLMQLLA